MLPTRNREKVRICFENRIEKIAAECLPSSRLSGEWFWAAGLQWKTPEHSFCTYMTCAITWNLQPRAPSKYTGLSLFSYDRSNFDCSAQATAFHSMRETHWWFNRAWFQRTRSFQTAFLLGMLPVYISELQSRTLRLSRQAVQLSFLRPFMRKIFCKWIYFPLLHWISGRSRPGCWKTAKERFPVTRNFMCADKAFVKSLYVVQAFHHCLPAHRHQQMKR